MNRLAMPGPSREGGPIHLVMGADHDLERLVVVHLFVICPNNSGSTFLQGALAACRATWNLPREGQETPGYVGPSSARPLQPGFPTTNLLWASDRFWMDRHADTDAYDWPRTRKAWYRLAYARDPRACVFVTKTPAHLLVVDDLARHFRNPRFLFMVRNPYAVCEGIFRQYGFLSHKFKALAEFRGTGRSLPEAAATHAVDCLARQRRNLEGHLNPEAGEARRGAPIVRSGRGVFFSYETMCAHPRRTARAIEAAAPAPASAGEGTLPGNADRHERPSSCAPRRAGRRGAQPGVRGASGDPRLLRLRPAADGPAAKRGCLVGLTGMLPDRREGRGASSGDDRFVSAPAERAGLPT